MSGRAPHKQKQHYGNRLAGPSLEYSVDFGGSSRFMVE